MSALTVAGLKALAGKKNVKLPKGAVKSDIVEMLLNAPAAVKSALAIKPAQTRTAVKRPAAKKAVANKAVPVKGVPKKASPLKAVVKKAATKKVAVKKAAVKKPAVKKPVSKVTVSQKAVPEKEAPKKAAAVKTAVKKTTPRAVKAAARKVAADKTVEKKTANNASGSNGYRKPPAQRTWIIPKKVALPLKAQEQVADAKYYTGLELDRSAMRRSSDQLSVEYGEDHITLMVRDPSMTYAYWEVTTGRLEREKAWFGMNAELVIRIYDITGVRFDGRNAIGYFDQAMADLIGSWYFETGRPGHSFCADIGLRSPDGRFLTLARSNFITMPRDGVSDVIDEEWMLADEKFWQLYGFPDGISSPQVQELWRRRHQQELSSPGLFSRVKGKTK